MSPGRGSLIRRRIMDRAYRFLVAHGECPFAAYCTAELLAESAQMCSEIKREPGETAWMIAKRVLTEAGDDFSTVR